MTTPNEQVIMALIEGLNRKDISVMGTLFHDDAVIEIPQSGERIVGVQDRLAVYEAMPLLPTITPRRLLSRDDVVVAEAAMDYDGAVYHVALIFELEDGRIKRETGYWANPLEAPEWRSKWVQRIA